MCVRACTQTPLTLPSALLRKTQFREGAEGAAMHLWQAVVTRKPTCASTADLTPARFKLALGSCS